MTQNAVQTITNTFPVAKQHGDRLARIIHILNSNVMLTESTLLSGTFDTVNAAGIPVPDAAPGASENGAGVLTGDYNWYITFYDEDRDSRGNPSSGVQLTSVASKKVLLDLTTISNEATNSRVSHMEIWRTLAGASVAFFVARVAAVTTSYEDNNSDATIQANDSLETDNDAPADSTYGVFKAHTSYGFSVGSSNPLGGTAYDDDFTWTKLVSADNQPLLNRTKIEPGRFGRLVTMEASGDVGIFYKERAIYELHFVTNPSAIFGDGFGKTMNTKRGTINPSTVVNVQGTHFVMDALGIYVNAGGTSQREIGRPLDRYWKRINWAEKAQFHAASDDAAAYFFVALDGESTMRYCFVFDLNAWHAQQPGVWTVYEFDFGVADSSEHRFGATGPSSSTLKYGMQNVSVVAIITDMGYTGYMRAGYRDFVDPVLTADSTVTAAVSTTSFTDLAATFSHTNKAGRTVTAVGAFVRFINPDADQPTSDDWAKPRRITSLTNGTTPVFTPALPEAPPVGTRYVVGGIPNELHTPVIGGQVPYYYKRAARTALEFQPGGVPFSCNMAISLDRKAPARTGMTLETGQINATQYEQGVPVKMGGALQDGGRIGVHATPPAGQGFRNIQVRLKAWWVDAPVIIDSIFIDELETEITNVP